MINCRRRTKEIQTLLFGLVLFAASVASALELYVAPNGNDAWTGKLARPNSTRDDGPLGTFTGARNAIRKMKQKGPLVEPVNVVFAGGRYELTAPVELDSQDTGTMEAPINYGAAPGATPVFSGGRAIGGWQPGTNGIWRAHLPEVAAGHWYFEQLWVNGQPCHSRSKPEQVLVLPAGG